jgi:2-polyprenyl-6-methoxyphenol hydroxylase-like FAD-dependent oxidoreductase
MSTAVVLGGGLAGVLVATVLARHADAVVLVEGGRYPAVPGPRSGLPQGYHNHVFVAGGVEALEALLPGTVGALLARGAHRRDLPGGALIRCAAGWFHRYETGAYLVSCSRWLADHVVRERALACGGVSVRERTQVLGLVGDASRVSGVVVAGPDGRVETIRADVVVDATGRRSRAPRWLADLGAAPMEEVTVDPGLAYSTRLYRAPADIARSIPAVMVHPCPASGRPGNGATLFPIEDGRWIVTLTGTRGSAPPVDGAGFTACAHGLGSPIVAELMAAAEPLGGVRPYRATANRRRFAERGTRPHGFLIVGDALMALNPVYSHGMSVAALTALRLAGELERHGLEPSAVATLQAVAATEAERPWRMATDRDRQPGRAGMSRAVPGNRMLMTAMFRAQTLLPGNGALDPSRLLAEAAAAAPPLTDDDEAIAQYPELSAWRSTAAGSTAAGERAAGVACAVPSPAHRAMSGGGRTR